MKKFKKKLKYIILDFLIKKYAMKPKIKEKKKILIISTDALGDIAIKQGFYRFIQKKYGEENVYFLINEKWESFFKRFKYRIFHLKRKKEKYGLVPRLKLIKKINDFNFKKIYSLDTINPEIDFNYLIAKEKLGFVTKKENGMTEPIMLKKQYEGIIDKILRLSKKEEKNVEKKDIISDLRPFFSNVKKENGIVLGVGASNIERTSSPKKMKDIIEKLLKIYPYEKIYLVGTGKKQKKYSVYLIDKIKNERLIDLVDEISLVEVVEKINHSLFFIGFDSGLYNISCSLKKKTIGIFNHFSSFEHNLKGVCVLMIDSKRSDINQKNIIYMDNYNTNYKDLEYGNKKLNNFDINYILRALKQLRVLNEENTNS